MRRNIRKITWIISFVFLITVLPGAAFGAVTMTLQSITKKVTTAYDALGAVEITESITIRHKGDATNFFLTFSTGQSADFSARVMTDTATTDQLLYQLYDNMTTQNVLKDLTGASVSSDVISGSFAANTKWQSATVSYVIHIPADQFVAQGKYTDSVTITLYEGDLTAYAQHDSQTVSYEAQMPQIAEISLVPTGQPFDSLQTSLLFDFGILEEGEAQGGDIVVRANATYTLSLQSDNQGVMAILDPTDTSTVPYDFSFNGSTVTLTGVLPVDVAASQPATDSFGQRFPFTVTILPYGMATEGSYEDNITVTLSTK